MKNRGGKRRELKGDQVVGGIALGSPFLYGTRTIEFPRYWITQGEVEKEKGRFFSSLDESRSQLNQIKSKLCRIQGREQITILDSHILLLQDDLLVRSVTGAIERDLINAEWALHVTLSEFKRAFSRFNEAYLRERQSDIEYMENTILRNLLGKSQEFFRKVPRGAIVVAYNLTPAETLHLLRFKIGGFVIERGGLNSHTAIVARSLAIPCVIGVEGISEAFSEDDFVILDGGQGKVIVNPRASEKKSYERLKEKELQSVREMKREAHGEAHTEDGFPVRILANMELLDEIDSVRESGASGVGLYRTEFLFLDREDEPTAEEQTRVYKRVLRELSPQEVTIRTIDLGAEKLKPGNHPLGQPNPALGLRAIRFCLQEKEIFENQLKALLTASTVGHLKICLPMIASVQEFRVVKRMIEDTRESLTKKGIRVAEKIPLGVMIETPAAAMEIDLLAQEADFFSVGTNDLIQYLLAVDRTNELVSYLYSPLHPSVLRVLKKVTDAATEFGKEVTLCGEMAADPVYLLLILALGFSRLSLNAASIPRIKKLVRESSMEKARGLLAKLLGGSSYKENQKILQTRMEELFPDYF